MFIPNNYMLGVIHIVYDILLYTWFKKKSILSSCYDLKSL